MCLPPPIGKPTKVCTQPQNQKAICIYQPEKPTYNILRQRIGECFSYNVKDETTLNASFIHGRCAPDLGTLSLAATEYSPDGFINDVNVSVKGLSVPQTEIVLRP